MNIEELLRNLELLKKYYDSNFDMSEKYAEEAKIFIDSLKCIIKKGFIEQRNQDVYVITNSGYKKVEG